MLVHFHADARVRSVRLGVEERGEEEEEEEEEVKSKRSWERQKESAKLLDLESPVDARRCV